jgi:hypothetical protein
VPTERGHSCPMPLGFGRLHPGGMFENSPAFQRWDDCRTTLSPEGTAEPKKPHFSRPSGTYFFTRPHPALKRWAILGCPSGTGTENGCSNPRGIGHSCPPLRVGQYRSPHRNIPADKNVRPPAALGWLGRVHSGVRVMAPRAAFGRTRAIRPVRAAGACAGGAYLGGGVRELLCPERSAPSRTRAAVSCA